MLSPQPHLGLNLPTLRSSPGLRPGVPCSADGTTQAPLLYILCNLSTYVVGMGRELKDPPER